STRQTKRAEAEKWRDQWIAGISQPPPPSQATIAEIMQAYTEARLPHVESKNTMLVLGRTIARRIGNLEPHMLARGTYAGLRWAENFAAGQIRREVPVIRDALAWANRERWIDEVPYVETPPASPPRDRWLTRDEVACLIRCARSAHLKLFVVLAYHT